MKKQSTFREATTGFPTKWRLKNKRRNSILMTYHYPDHGSISDWSCNYLHQPIRSTTQIWVVTLHQYGISALVTQTSFREETSSDVNGNVGCFLRLTTTSSSNGTAREKRPISLLGARDKKGGTWHPTLTKHRSLSRGARLLPLSRGGLIYHYPSNESTC